ncbi:hypothetical protein B0T21DRAFT_386166 [Apiosordaria backusii]|uniref:Uncharacterized protein n=1 Tax=Apiosordaria backusii TaxID=314023 RepID=A0AA40ASP0_9PEZI|nr:hypothetical protein B0T21DRAFT_386166 [Apiosordaria backusii]
MGWFSSALQGIGHAVNWIKQNSGTISQAASTIAQVAGAVGLAEGEEPADALFPNFTAAAAKVAAAAGDGAQQQLEKVLDSFPAQIKNDPTLEVTAAAVPAETTFLWFDPAPVDSEGQPNRGLVRDLGKMLTARSFPTVLPSGSGDINAVDFGWLDVGLRIGQAIFGNLGAVEIIKDGLIQSTRFSIPSGDGSCVITGCHAYYNIPLGQTGTNSAWHAGLVMHKITTASYRKLESARNKSLTLTHSVKNDSSEPQWLCTMNVQWEDSVSANIVAPKLIQQLQANTQGYVLHHCSLDGMDQHIKIQCPNDTTPTQAKGLVRQCVKTAMSDSGLVTAVATSHFLTPDVQLTMSTLILPSTTN